MPYIQPTWAKLVQPPGQHVGPGAGGSRISANQGEDGINRTLRTVPHDEKYKGAPTGTSETNEVKPPQPMPDPAQRTRMQCSLNIVSSQVEELERANPGDSTEDESFFRYSIGVDVVMFCGKYSNIYLAHHNDKPDFHLIARVFEPTAKVDPHRSKYLKVLKHLGRRNPYVIGTWDVFFDTNGRVVIFQEYALYGNLQQYITQNNVYVPEPQLHEWAQQVYLGMSFLGDAGVCHRAINPKHLLLTTVEDDETKTLLKLGSFRDAIIYYDPKGGRIRNQPCRPLEKRNVANYQAPEVFGEANEEFDPIAADVWSYGASFFFAATRLYPYRYKSSAHADIGLDIQKTIEQAKVLSEQCKSWFNALLNADVTQRIEFNKIEAEPWFKTTF